MGRFDTPFFQKRLMDAESVVAKFPKHTTLATSGFTPAGYPKVIPPAYAKRIVEERAKGNELTLSLYTGASTGGELDGELAKSGGLKFRIPYQTNDDLRKGINAGTINYTDMHLSHVSSFIKNGILNPIDVAVVEAVDVTSDGKIYLTTSGGVTPTYLQYAKEIYIELNEFHHLALKGYHDAYVPPTPPNTRPLFITHPDDRIGTPYVQVDPEKIKGIVKTNLMDSASDFKPSDETSMHIAGHILDFLVEEIKKGRIPKTYLPFQFGVGNVANAVLACMATDNRINSIQMYTEVLMDAAFPLLDSGKLNFASTSSLTFSKAGQKRFQDEIEDLRSKIVIRPQEISNHPEVIRRLGVIAMNTALEMDIFGNVNSTHVLGSKMMNGIGGSGDFTRNGFISVFMAPSVQKNGDISSIVPMVSHVDHNEHSTQIFVTEQGLADLRGLSPTQRAKKIIDVCVHPDYKDMLRDYLKESAAKAAGKHTPHDLEHAFDFHVRFAKTGSMKMK